MANAVAAVTAAPASPANLLPDLGIRSGTVNAGLQSNVVAGRQVVEFNWTQRTENTGHATAPQSKTAVKIGAVTPSGASVQVPQLRKFKVSKPNIGNFDQDFAGWQFGTYRLQICADAPKKIDEESEDNNCRNGSAFHYVPKRLKGTVVGSNLLFGTVYLKWTASVDAEFLNVAVEGDKVTARYDMKNVEVIYAFSGEFGGCRYSGTATDKPQAQRIRLSFSPGAGSFTANNLANPDFTVPLRIRCPDAPPLDIKHFDGSFAWFALNSSPKFSNPGLESLIGTEKFGSTKTTWNLTAQDE